MTMENPPIDELQRIESLAAELAALAGADIQFALGKAMQVSYKGEPGWMRDPDCRCSQPPLACSTVAVRLPARCGVQPPMCCAPVSTPLMSAAP